MAYACDICNKGKQYGHNVPFSQKKTNKVWKPNLQRHHLNLGNSRIRVKICTQCLKTLAKYERQDKAKLAAVASSTPDKPMADKPKAEQAATPRANAKKPAAKA